MKPYIQFHVEKEMKTKMPFTNREEDLVSQLLALGPTHGSTGGSLREGRKEWLEDHVEQD